MVVDRIVSFLPSATELLYEFGVEDMLFGVTHECKYPDTAKLKPQVISSEREMKKKIEKFGAETKLFLILKKRENYIKLN